MQPNPKYTSTTITELQIRELVARLDELKRLLHPNLWALDSRAKWAAESRIAELEAQLKALSQ